MDSVILRKKARRDELTLEEIEFIQNKITKKCKVCKALKRCKEFHPLKSGKYGVRADCKLCRKERNEKYYAVNKERLWNIHAKIKA